MSVNDWVADLLSVVFVDAAYGFLGQFVTAFVILGVPLLIIDLIFNVYEVISGRHTSDSGSDVKPYQFMTPRQRGQVINRRGPRRYQ